MREPYVIVWMKNEIYGGVVFCPTEMVADMLLHQIRCMLAIKMPAREWR